MSYFDVFTSGNMTIRDKYQMQQVTTLEINATRINYFFSPCIEIQYEANNTAARVSTHYDGGQSIFVIEFLKKEPLKTEKHWKSVANKYEGKCKSKEPARDEK